MAKNNIKSATVAYGNVTASNTSLLALGTTYLYDQLMIANSLNTAVTLTIGSNEIYVAANKNITMNKVSVNGTIYIKYSSSAPTSGSLELSCGVKKHGCGHRAQS